MIPVLIVSGGGFQGLGLLESLQRLAHVAPIVADVYQDNVTRYLSPRYVQVPPLADEAAFTDALLALVRERGVRAVFPATAHELPLLARLRDRFARAGAQVAVSDPSLVEILLDKQATHRFLLAHGLPVQAPVDPDGHDFSRPLFGKPRHGWGGTGTVLARSPAEARHADARPGGAPLLWFPYLERFEEYSLDLAISPSGHVSPLVLRQRLRTTGGYAAISRTASRAPLRALARRIADVLAASGGRGILNVQFIVADDGEPFVSDVNPRFGTSAVHALAEGVNLPGFFLEDQAPGPDADARGAPPGRCATSRRSRCPCCASAPTRWSSTSPPPWSTTSCGWRTGSPPPTTPSHADGPTRTRSPSPRCRPSTRANAASSSTGCARRSAGRSASARPCSRPTAARRAARRRCTPTSPRRWRPCAMPACGWPSSPTIRSPPSAPSSNVRPCCATWPRSSRARPARKSRPPW